MLSKSLDCPPNLANLCTQILLILTQISRSWLHRKEFSQLVGKAECTHPEGKRECNDAFSVRFVRSA